VASKPAFERFLRWVTTQPGLDLFTRFNGLYEDASDLDLSSYFPRSSLVSSRLSLVTTFHPLEPGISKVAWMIHEVEEYNLRA
jgi:hypothetical protein